MRHFLSHVGFIYDIYDIRLIKWIDETDWLNKYLSILPNPKDNDSLEQISKAANEYVKKYLFLHELRSQRQKPTGGY